MAAAAPPRPGRPVFPALGRLSREPRLPGKVCVISGASRGFGQAIAIRFVEEGARVRCWRGRVLISECNTEQVALLSRGHCDDTLKLIEKIEGVQSASDVALYVPCDLASEADIKWAVKEVTQRFGEVVHVLINNAAAFIFHSVETATAEDWDQSAAVNIRGHALLTKEVLPHMKKANGASIVFQGSISSFLAQPNCATYATMKGAIVQMARNCAYDFAKYKIRVNSVCAGTIETPISAEERKAHGWDYDTWEKLKIKDVMMGRVGDVREVCSPIPFSELVLICYPPSIANATLFFACDESSYCTGTHLMVDGGQTPCTVME